MRWKEERYFLSRFPFAVALCHFDGRLFYANSGFCCLAGIDQKELPRKINDLVIKEDSDFLSSSLERIVKGHDSFLHDVRLHFKPSRHETSILKIMTIESAGQEVLLLALHDNKEQVRLEKQVAQATKMQAMGQLSGGIAHDFNNILTAIMGHCDLLLATQKMHDHNEETHTTSELRHIRTNAQRAADLVRQLLAFSRKQTLSMQNVSVTSVIDEVRVLLHRLLGEAIEVEITHEVEQGFIRADSGQLGQILINLAVNARDAMHDGGKLEIKSRKIPASDVAALGHEIMPQIDYIEITVTDEGSGIATGSMDQIFDPFFTTKDVGQGTGLGVSTVYGIVKQSSGFIFAKNNSAGKGAIFTLYFPALSLDEATENKKEEAPPTSQELPPETVSQSKKTILFVEDEEAVRNIITQALSRYGFDVVNAEDGEKALTYLSIFGDNVDLLISDVVMPHMDGPSLWKKAEELKLNFPALFVSGYDREKMQESLENSRVRFLAKPFSVKDLLKAVEETLVLS